MGEDKLIALIQESLAVAIRTETAKPADFRQVVIDTTVQEKAIAFPTDAKLMHRAHVRLVRLAQATGVNLRQSYVRVSLPVMITGRLRCLAFSSRGMPRSIGSDVSRASTTHAGTRADEAGLRYSSCVVSAFAIQTTSITCSANCRTRSSLSRRACSARFSRSMSCTTVTAPTTSWAAFRNGAALWRVQPFHPSGKVKRKSFPGATVSPRNARAPGYSERSRRWPSGV